MNASSEAGGPAAPTASAGERGGSRHVPDATPATTPKSADSPPPPIIEADDGVARNRIDPRRLAHEYVRLAIDHYESVADAFERVTAASLVAEHALCYPVRRARDHAGPDDDRRGENYRATVRWLNWRAVVGNALQNAAREVVRCVVAFDPNAHEVMLWKAEEYYWTPRAYAHKGKLYVVAADDMNEFEPGRHMGRPVSMLTVLDDRDVIAAPAEKGGER